MKYPEPYQRGKYFSFTYIEHGKRRQRSTGKTTKRDAREFIRSFMDRMDAGSGASFADYADPYFIPGRCPHEARLREERKTFGEVHMRRSRYWLDRYILTDPAFPQKPMREITRGDVLDLRRRLTQRLPDKLNAAGKAFEAVKTILSEAEYRQDIATNPGRGVPVPAYEERERGSFTVDEVRLILQYLPDLVATDKAKTPEQGRRPRMDALFTTLFLAGLRLGEARAWRWADVDLEHSRFSVMQAVKGAKIGDPKWNKQRPDLALPSLLRERLIRWKSEAPFVGEYVFASIDDEPVSETVIRKAWYRMMEHAANHEKVKLAPGDRWLTPHSCRHTLNTHLIAARVPALDVQLYLGWSSDMAKMLTKVQTGYTDMRLLDTSTVAVAVDKLYATEVARRRARG